MIDSNDILPPPHPNDHPQNEMWLDEQIWGHRLWDRESPWLVFLEFLGVAEACHRDARLLDQTSRPYPFSFAPQKRLYLRNILFNNEAIFRIAERNADSTTAWSEWLQWMEDSAKGVTRRDFSYLRDRFHSFQNFAALVGMLRASAVESDSNKRWSSRFVFPFGRNALYEDLNITPTGSVSREYINFGRTGELLYQMLNRSRQAEELRPGLVDMISGDNPWNALIGLMQPDTAADATERGDSFLPYRRHAAFDRLGGDWLEIHRLELPGFDAYPHLVVLSALHLMLYQLETAAYWCGEERPHFICEVVAPRKTLVRELSALNFQSNQLLSQRAVERVIADFESGDAWRAAATGEAAFSRCKELLKDRFRWPTEQEDYDGCSNPDDLVRAFRRKAIDRHRRHLANGHRAYGGEVGLVSKRGTNRLRYAPTDSLLKALILANVERRMEYNAFLDKLFERYGLVLGDRAGAKVLKREDFDQKAFRANARRLEQRLTSLGMLRRLSDACAYVENPYSGGVR